MVVSRTENEGYEFSTRVYAFTGRILWFLKRLSVQVAHFFFKLFHRPFGFDIGGDIGDG